MKYFTGIKKKTWVFEDMVFIKPLSLLRKTPSVEFYNVRDVVNGLSAIDKVIHQKGAKSPRIKGDITWYWYMHPDQQDNLLVHEGKRIVELFERKHGKVERFEVTHNRIKHNEKIIFKGAAILGWPRNVFHRIHSPQGSISTNYAIHYKHFSIKSNFNIYDLDTKTGEYKLVREGHKDQPNYK